MSIRGKGFDRLRLGAAAGAMGLGALGGFGGFSTARAATAALPMNITLTTEGTQPDIRWELNNAAAFAGMAGGMGIGDGVTWEGDGGQSHNDPFDNAMSFTLNGTAVSAPAGQVDLVEEGSDKATVTILTPAPVQGLNATVQFYFAGRTLRNMLILENPDTEDITVNVRTGYNSGPGTAGLVETSSGDATFENTDTWFIARDTGGSGGQPHLTVLRFLEGASVAPTAVTPPGNVSGNYVDSYDVTVPAGETRRIIIFLSMTRASVLADAQAMAANYDDIDTIAAAPGDLLAGLSNAELAQVVNFLVSEPPVISDLDGDSVDAADDTSTLIDAGGNATVTDNDSDNFDGGEFTITRTTAPALDGDFSLSGNGGSGVSAGTTIGDADGELAVGETIFVDGTAIGVVTADSQGTSDLTIELNADATPATVQALLRAVQYRSTTSGDHTFELTVNDGDNDSEAASFTVRLDGDGIAPDIEAGAPNDGDGNDDGIPDAEQAHVASLTTNTDQGYMTLVVGGGCDEIRDVAAVAPSSIVDNPGAYDFPFGLVEFVLPCETATVEIIYHGADEETFSGATYRKYGPTVPGDDSTAAWYDFSDFSSRSGNTWTLNLADNQLGDDTGDDGLIVDQGGPAIPVPLSIPVNQPWALALMSALLALFVGRGRRKKHRA